MQGGGQFAPRSLSWPLPYDWSKELIGKGDPGEVPDKTVLKLRNVKDPLRFAVRAEGRTRPPNLVLGYFQQPAMTREEAWRLSLLSQGRWSMAYMLGMKRLCPSQASPHTGKGTEAWTAALDKTVPFPACHHPCGRGSLYATTSHDTWLSSSAFTPAWLWMISSDWTLDLSGGIWRLARQLSWHRLAQKR